MGFDRDSAWFRDYLARAQVGPAMPRGRLLIGSRVCGSVEPRLAQEMVQAGLPVQASGDGWAVTGAPDESLHAMARWLHANGHGGKWRHERVAVTDEQGQVVAAVERAAVRVLGIATQAVHLVGSDADGRVWVQRRALDKAVDPGMLDTLVGGLAAFGESVATTLEREAWEEAGLRLADLGEVRDIGRAVVRRPVSDGYMVEHMAMFSAQVPSHMVPSNQDGEVMGFDCLAVDDLVRRMSAGEFTFEAVLIHSAWIEAQSSLHLGR
ncbi:NUDIX hydrolase [Piscinibacter terrae]|uniref:NUDIX domain-containing protein n=1 Tax=Piscinibacter terrae TaxID=2496871 RepID=A0A3N7HXX7_9BURK|nr:NUDIX domain-containing protein [Albitalea terrae]RQP25921.1 NUDIX domain-containing protein [Albitalea terrae]